MVIATKSVEAPPLVDLREVEALDWPRFGVHVFRLVHTARNAAT